MDTDRLRYFCLIAETGSLTKASEILNISHSGLSKAMSQLQNELNLTLFRPQGRGLELTEEAKVLYQKSKEVLKLIENLNKTETTSSQKALRIGLTEIFSVAFGDRIAKELNLPVDLYDLDSGEIEVKLLEGQIDFAISTVPFPHPQLDHLKIAKTPMAVFYHNRDFAKMRLEQIPFVGPNSELKNNPLSIRARDGWPEKQQRNLIYGASSFTTALGIVDSGKAAIFIPKFLANTLNEKRTSQHQLHEHHVPRSFFKEAERDVYLVKRKNIEESKAMKTVARIIRKYCAPSAEG